MNDKDLDALMIEVSQHSKEIERLNDEMKEVRDETKAIHNINTNMATMLTELHHMNTNIAEMKADQKDMKVESAQIKDNVTGIHSKISELEARPSVERAKRWDGIWDKAIGGVVGAVLMGVIVYLLTHISL